MTTMSTDQIQMLQNLLETLNAIKGSVTTTKTKTTTTKVKKMKDPNAPKRAPNAKIIAMNDERKKIYAEMQASYFEANPSAVGIEPTEIRKMAKEGKMPPFPTYPQALKEHSRRMSEADPEHAKKAKAYRERIDAKQAEKRSSKGTDTSSERSEQDLEETEMIEDDSSVVTLIAPAVAPVVIAPVAIAPVAIAPVVIAPIAPVVEEKKAKGRPKKVKTASKPSPTITKKFDTEDTEEFNLNLEIDSETFLMNGENWVITKEDQTWVGLWDSEKKEIDRTAPEPDSDE